MNQNQFVSAAASGNAGQIGLGLQELRSDRKTMNKALRAALVSQHSAIIDLLLDAGVVPSQDLFEIALRTGNHRICETLLASGVRLKEEAPEVPGETRGATALATATALGDSRMVEMLTKAGVAGWSPEIRPESLTAYEEGRYWTNTPFHWQEKVTTRRPVERKLHGKGYFRFDEHVQPTPEIHAQMIRDFCVSTTSPDVTILSRDAEVRSDTYSFRIFRDGNWHTTSIPAEQISVSIKIRLERPAKHGKTVYGVQARFPGALLAANTLRSVHPVSVPEIRFSVFCYGDRGLRASESLETHATVTGAAVVGSLVFAFIFPPLAAISGLVALVCAILTIRDGFYRLLYRWRAGIPGRRAQVEPGE